MRFIKKAVIAMFVSIGVFVIVCLILYEKKGGVPDVLVQEFFTFFKLQGGFTTLITVADLGTDALVKIKKKGCENETEETTPI